MTRPLLVKLHNWIGDVVVGLPALKRLAAHGCELTLVGKPWAASLLAGHGWTVHPLAHGVRARAAQWRRLRATVVGPAAKAPPAPGLDALLLATSFSSALEARLGGVRAAGFDTDHRRALLARSLPRPRGAVHALEETWQLAGRFLDLGDDRPPPASIGLVPALQAQDGARARLAAHGVAVGGGEGDSDSPGEGSRDGGFVVLCPFAVGRFEGRSKAWPHFAALAARLRAARQTVVLCPGPGDEARQARDDFPGAVVLDGVPLGEYAAVLGLATRVVANDTGPGHMAAAVGAPLVSVLGPTDAARWAPWGPSVRVVQGDGGAWPTLEAVEAALGEAPPRAG